MLSYFSVILLMLILLLSRSLSYFYNIKIGQEPLKPLCHSRLCLVVINEFVLLMTLSLYEYDRFAYDVIGSNKKAGYININ